jgi:transcription initiation factor TFIID subunit 10
MSDTPTPQPEASGSAQPAAAAQEAAAGPSQGHTRREEELARKDRTLAEFMLMLDEYEPLVSSGACRRGHGTDWSFRFRRR